MIDASALVRDAVNAGDGSTRSSWRHLMAAMVERLAALADELPPVGTQALQVADGYWRRFAGDSGDLLDAKVSCWNHLDAKHGSSTAIVDREDQLLRGLLCVLNPEGDEAAMADTTEWFAEMMNKAMPAE